MLYQILTCMGFEKFIYFSHSKMFYGGLDLDPKTGTNVIIDMFMSLLWVRLSRQVTISWSRHHLLYSHNFTTVLMKPPLSSFELVESDRLLRSFFRTRNILPSTPLSTLLCLSLISYY